MKWFARLIWIPLALAGAVFAIANRQTVTLSLWPLPWEATLPLFLILIAVLLLGVLIGGAIVWLGGHRYRVTARQQTRASTELRRQVSALKTAPSPAAAALPPPQHAGAGTGSGGSLAQKPPA